MVSGVLTLGEHAIRSIMTPRKDMSQINIESDEVAIRESLLGIALRVSSNIRLPETLFLVDVAAAKNTKQRFMP